MKAHMIARKTVFLWLINTLLLVSACLPSPKNPKLDIPGVSLLEQPSHGQIADAAWSPDSQSMLVVNLDDDRGPRNSMHLLDAQTGKMTKLLESMKLINVQNPNFSPSGGTAMFDAASSPAGSGIHELNLQTGELKVRFDALFAAWSNSQDSVALLNATECKGVDQRYWICVLDAATGEFKTIYATKRVVEFGGMAWSRDNKYLAISFGEKDLDSTSPRRRRIYIYDLQSDQYSPITPDSVDAYDPAWSLDNKYIAYSQNARTMGEAQIMIMHTNGSCPIPLIPVKNLSLNLLWT